MQIGSLEHPLFLLALRRLDPAIKWNDIHMRMPIDARPNRGDTISDRIKRNFDEPFFLFPWHEIPRGDIWTKPACMAIRYRLTDDALRKNSSRGFAPGLIDPSLGEIRGNRIPWPDKLKRGVGLGSNWRFRFHGPERDYYLYMARKTGGVGTFGPRVDDDQLTLTQAQRDEIAEDERELRRAPIDPSWSPNSMQKALISWQGFMEDGVTDGERAIKEAQALVDPNLSPSSHSKAVIEKVGYHFPDLE